MLRSIQPYSFRALRWGLVGLCMSLFVLGGVHAQSTEDLVPRFERATSGLHLERATQSGAFFDVVGRRAATFGYENETFEVWTYPLKILKAFKLEFRIEGYSPHSIPGPDVMTHIDVRPEATTITYTHAAFTVRQIIFAPVHEPGIVMLLDVDSVHPLEIAASFRPDLRLMWPAGLMTANTIWNADAHTYTFVVDRRPFVGMVGAPGGHDVSMMPYQEEPRDIPNRLVINTTPETAADYFYPIVVAGSVEGRAAARRTYDTLLHATDSLYQSNVQYYRDLQATATQIHTPDERLNTAFAWAKVGIDKGMATNPMLGTGLVAGFRTSGASERPGFAWFFGRDALWTAFALTATGDLESTRTALNFLEQFQRDDGKIPHEISQSAALVPWFEEYPYPWASADATPLYVIVHADLWRTTGDRAYLRDHWPSIKKAYRFTAGTDTDGNHLIENTNVGHGWVEGGALYPAHEEMYMQGLWVEAARSMAVLAEVMGEEALAAEARRAAEQTRQAMEDTYWLDDAGFYAFATKRPPGSGELYREDTVLPAVPMWWETLDDARAQAALDHVGSGALATDWGLRILSARSDLYDPLAYHYGSVWPLFTGWAAMGAYQYTRPHVGVQALMANALLTYQDAYGYVTELLSGDYNTAFGRSSHHQIWSEAMVVTPALRGLLGVDVVAAGQTLRFAPQLPASWDSVAVRNVRVGTQRFDLRFHRSTDQLRFTAERQQGGGEGLQHIVFAPALPLNADVQRVRVNGEVASFKTQRQGDRKHIIVTVDEITPTTAVVFDYMPGTDVYLRPTVPAEGATNQGLRVLRSRARADTLELVLEGRGGHTYTLHARSPHRIGTADGVTVSRRDGEDAALRITFEGAGDTYVRRTVRLPVQKP